MKYKLLFIAFFASLMGWGQLSITTTGTAYTQNFDGMPTTGTSLSASGNIFSNGWSFLETGTNSNLTYQAGNGSGTSGDTYSWGVAGANLISDRAFGILQSGNLSSIIGFKFTNNTGSNISTLIIGYTGELWRTSSAVDNLVFSYQLSNAALNASSGWINVSSLNFATPVTGTATQKDGNLSVNRSVIGPVTISGLNIPDGSTVTIRWVDSSGSSSAAMGIDDFSITAYSPNPSPATLPYSQNFEGVYNEWNLGTNSPNSWVVGSATNNGGSKALYVSNNGSANSYTEASSGTTAQTIASFQVDLTGAQNAQLAFDWKSNGEENYDYGDVWINTGGNDILLSYMDPQIADSGQYGEFFNSSTFANKVINLGAYVGGVVTIKFRWRCDDVINQNPPFAIDNVAVTAIAPAVVPPTISTFYIGSVTTTSAVVGCNITAQGTNAITERGLCVATTSNPTVSDTKIISGSGTGSYDVSVTNLTMSTHYYVRAYAITSAGVYYSNQMDFTTANIGAPTASNASNVTENSFTSNWSAVSGAASYRLDVSTSAATFTNYEAFGSFIVFDFENGLQSNPNPNLTNATNTSAYLFAYGGPGNTGLANYANDTGNGGEVKKVTGWHDGNDTKYWRVNFSTLGKFNLKLSSKQRSDSNGPKNWKLQYSIGQDGSENWIDISGGTIVVADNYTSGYLNQLSLPSQMENLSIVSLRWVMTSNTSVSNGTVTSAGISNIDDIVVYGDTPQTLVPGFDNLTVNTTSKSVTGLNPNTNYYYRVRAVAPSSTSINSNVVSLSTLNRTTWNSSSWSNGSPTATLDALIDGNLTTSSDLACKDLTINAGKTLTVGAGKKLTVAGNLINNGTIVFKSDATGTAVFGVFNGSQSGTGTVTTERYIPARRAFRFVSAPVTTTTTIKQNWQENAGSTAGLGTHITGTGGATNGFDATETNNPSLFTFTSGAWVAVTNTNVNVLTAGTPYRLMVRGDRTTDLTSNAPTATATTLRATGTLKTGSFSPTINQTADGYSLIGNPYQAPIDIKAILTAASNMNAGVAYYWDPTLNTRGGYVTRDLTTDVNDVTSGFNQYVQPGQAVFVKRDNTGNAASVTITESHKSVANGAAGVFRTTTPNDFGLLRVNLQANTNNQWQNIEGTLALFNDNFSWNVTPEDATKMSNLDEEVSFVQNNTSLAIACLSAPNANSELPIKLNNIRQSNYQWQFELANYQGERPYLYDAQNNSYTEITNGVVVPFTATTAAANRFKIVFQPSALSTDDFANGLVVYPNPAKAGASFFVQGITAAQVTVYNVLGQHVPVQVKNQGNALQVTPTQTLSQGIYLVTVTTEGKTQHVKWIVE